jgi:large subunit ribosomal protein L19
MNNAAKTFLQSFLRKDLPSLRPGDTVKVFQKIKEGEKDRLQVFEGQVVTQKHGKELGATVTLRKVISGVGVERIFPLHSPTIEKIEIVKKGKARRAKLYYLRKVKGKKARLSILFHMFIRRIKIDILVLELLTGLARPRGGLRGGLFLTG